MYICPYLWLSSSHHPPVTGTLFSEYIPICCGSLPHQSCCLKSILIRRRRMNNHGSSSCSNSTDYITSGRRRSHMDILGASTNCMLSFQDDMMTIASSVVDVKALPTTSNGSIYSMEMPVERLFTSLHKNRTPQKDNEGIFSMQMLKQPLVKAKRIIEPRKATPKEISLPSLNGSSFRTRNHRSSVMNHMTIGRDHSKPKIGITTPIEYQMSIDPIIGRTRLAQEAALPMNGNGSISSYKMDPIDGETDSSAAITLSQPVPCATWTRTRLDLIPGQPSHMVGLQEALSAYQQNECQDTVCTQCETFLYCIDTAGMVLCPTCRSVGPLSNGSSANLTIQASKKHRQANTICIGLTVDMILDANLLMD